MRRVVLVILTIILTVNLFGCTERPEISEDSLLGSEKLIKDKPEVENAEVNIEDGSITFYIVPSSQEISNDKIKEISTDFIKVLGGYTAGGGLQGPTDSSYGDIYNYYDVEITVEGNRRILARGTMKKKTHEITWEENNSK